MHLKGFWRGKPIKPDWRDKLKVGDIVLSPNGTERIVRKVKYFNNLLGWVSFVILHCSWTGRCYTCYSRSDLKRYSPTKHSIALITPLDKEIAEAIQADKVTVTCCDVEGLR